MNADFNLEYMINIDLFRAISNQACCNDNINHLTVFDFRLYIDPELQAIFMDDTMGHYKLLTRRAK